MTKLHQLKPKPAEVVEGGGGAGGSTDLPMTRALQITVSQQVHVLIMRLGALRVEKGYKPSSATKSAIIEAAILAMAKSEGLI